MSHFSTAKSCVIEISHDSGGKLKPTEFIWPSVWHDRLYTVMSVKVVCAVIECKMYSQCMYNHVLEREEE